MADTKHMTGPDPRNHDPRQAEHGETAPSKPEWRIRAVFLRKEAGTVVSGAGPANLHSFVDADGWTFQETRNGDIFVDRTLQPGSPGAKPIRQHWKLGHSCIRWVDYVLNDPE